MPNKNRVLILQELDEIDNISEVYRYANSLVEQGQVPDVLFASHETIAAIETIHGFALSVESDRQRSEKGFQEFQTLVELINKELQGKEGLPDNPSIASFWSYDEVMQTIPNQKSSYSEPEKPREFGHAVEKVWDEIYDLQHGETALVTMPLFDPTIEGHSPKPGYYDQAIIVRELAKTAIRRGANPIIKMAVPLKDMDAVGSPLTQLLYNMYAFEFSSPVSTPIFEAFGELSGAIALRDAIPIPQAYLEIRGDGKEGKDIFGQNIGYQILSENHSLLWSDPLHMLHQPFYFWEHSIADQRQPALRKCLTETLDIELFTKATDIDYEEMRANNHKIKEKAENCDRIIVRGDSIKAGEYTFKTYMEVDLTDGDKGRRHWHVSDALCKTIIDQQREGPNNEPFGSFGNSPAGEAYVTPNSIAGISDPALIDTKYLRYINDTFQANLPQGFGNVVGTYVADVVGSLDKPYDVSGDRTLVIGFNDRGQWAVLYAPEDVSGAIERLRTQQRNILDGQLQDQVITPDTHSRLVAMMDDVGEFAINTNTNAPPSTDYLVVAEKAKNCIHIALGSGFDDKSGDVYHWDLVADAKRQNLEIVGFGEEKYLFMQQGNLFDYVPSGKGNTDLK